MPKVKKGEFIREVEGLKIYASLQKAKRTGKDRLWIQVRQNKLKKWSIAASLGYVNGFDVRFEKDHEKIISLK